MKIYNVAGVMSGTSLDGLDVAICRFENERNSWNFEIIKAKTFEYSEMWKVKLRNAHRLNGFDLLLLHNEYGTYIAEVVRKFLDDSGKKVDFISSHGHTVFHQPEKHITFQLGNGAYIAANSRITTISDFRSLDVSLSGQGAPLVPIGDEFLFSDFGFCLNLGGISNISFKENDIRKAFDICPVNMALNHFAQILGKEFDENGNIGKNGKLIRTLYDRLNLLEYYQQKFPKSLGREWFEKVFLPVIKTGSFSVEDILFTLYEHIAFQISENVKFKSKTKILATGGGAKNEYLIQRIRNLSFHEIVIPSLEIIDFKEALIFAFLGVLRFENKVNCLQSVTGAKCDNIGGIIYLM